MGPKDCLAYIKPQCRISCINYLQKTDIKSTSNCVCFWILILIVLPFGVLKIYIKNRILDWTRKKTRTNFKKTSCLITSSTTFSRAARHPSWESKLLNSKRGSMHQSNTDDPYTNCFLNFSEWRSQPFRARVKPLNPDKYTLLISTGGSKHGRNRRPPPPTPLTKCRGWSWLHEAHFSLNRFIWILNFGPSYV